MAAGLTRPSFRSRGCSQLLWKVAILSLALEELQHSHFIGLTTFDMTGKRVLRVDGLITFVLDETFHGICGVCRHLCCSCEALWIKSTTFSRRRCQTSRCASSMSPCSSTCTSSSGCVRVFYNMHFLEFLSSVEEYRRGSETWMGKGVFCLPLVTVSCFCAVLSRNYIKGFKNEKIYLQLEQLLFMCSFYLLSWHI